MFRISAGDAVLNALHEHVDGLPEEAAVVMQRHFLAQHAEPFTALGGDGTVATFGRTRRHGGSFYLPV